MVRIEWDFDEEVEVNKKKALKILNNFLAVDGLEEVLKQTQGLVYSSFFKELYDDRLGALKDFNENYGSFFSDKSGLSVDDYPQFSYATILSKQKFYAFFYKEVVAYHHFTSFFVTVVSIGLLKRNGELPHNEVANFLNRVIFLLDDFDKNIPFDSPDLDFFKALKDIRWDKKGKKLFDKIYGILDHVIDLVSDGEFASLHSYKSSFINTIFFGLVFLTGCVCVGRGGSRMSVDDVVVAYKTFFKLLDCDGSDIAL